MGGKKSDGEADEGHTAFMMKGVEKYENYNNIDKLKFLQREVAGKEQYTQLTREDRNKKQKYTFIVRRGWNEKNMDTPW